MKKTLPPRLPHTEDQDPPNRRRSVATHFFKLAYVLVALGIQQGAMVLAFSLVYSGRALESSIQSYIHSIPVMIVASLVFIDYFGMTHFFRKTHGDLVSACFKLVGLVMLITTAFAFFFQFFTFPRYVIVVGGALMFAGLAAWSMLTLQISYKVYANGKLGLVAVDRDDAVRLLRKARSGFKALHIDYVGWAPAGDPARVRRLIRISSEVLVSDSVPDSVKTDLLLACADMDRTVYMVPQFYELAYTRFRVIQFDDTPTFMIDNLGLTFQQRLFKRIFDLAFSLLALVLTLPIQLLLALLIRLDSRGPAIYTQERNTLNGKVFCVYKFRTMKKDAEARYGAYQSSETDPRLTRIGRFLRRHHLDELPQFLNVLKGEMSVVGPRSDRPITIDRFESRIPGYRQRLKVKSGITGLAQVMGHYNTDPEDKLRFDLMYMKNYSLLLDLRIIGLTILAVLRPNGHSKVKTTSDYYVGPEPTGDTSTGTGGEPRDADSAGPGSDLGSDPGADAPER